MRKRTRAEDNIKWIQDFCRVPEGKLIGSKVKLRPWQKYELKKIYDNPKGTRRAIISFGRKNGKTSLAAFLLLLHLVGFEKRYNSQLFSAATSRDQAALIFNLAAKIVRMSPDLSRAVVIRDTAKQLYCPQLGTLYRALSAEASTAMGLSPVFIVHDELGQVRGPRSELYEALETATGAQESPLSVIISTQAPTDNDLLSILIDDAKAKYDPHVVLSLYTADEKDDAFAEATIKKANPAFGDFLNPKEVKAMAADAKRMPSREPEYRNLVLNQRVDASTPFMARSLWATCDAEPKPITDVPVYAGLDLSSVADLTAFVMVGKVGGVWQVHPKFWLPADGLHDKAIQDRVPYDLWAKKKQLLTAPGKSVDYEYVAQVLFEDFGKYDIRKIGFDLWNMRSLMPWLLHAGFTESQIADKFVEFGQGFRSMSPALRTLEGEILNKRVAHGDHPVLTMCAANAVIQADPAGNRKLTKAKSVGRIDGMVALAMAFGVMPEASEKPRAFDMMFV